MEAELNENCPTQLTDYCVCVRVVHGGNTINPILFIFCLVDLKFDVTEMW